MDSWYLHEILQPNGAPHRIMFWHYRWNQARIKVFNFWYRLPRIFMGIRQKWSRYHTIDFVEFWMYAFGKVDVNLDAVRWYFLFYKVQISTSSNNYFIKIPKRGAIFNHPNQLITHTFPFNLESIKCYESNVPLLQFSPQLLQSPIKQPSKRRDPFFPRQRTTKGSTLVPFDKRNGWI